MDESFSGSSGTDSFFAAATLAQMGLPAIGLF